MAISQILDYIKRVKTRIQKCRMLGIFFEVVSRRRFSDDVNHGFQWGKLCVVGSIHGILDVGSLEDDAETFYFCSSVPSSCLVFLLSSSRLFGSQFSRVGMAIPSANFTFSVPQVKQTLFQIVQSCHFPRKDYLIGNK